MGPRQQGRIPRRPVTPASADYRYRQELALALFTQPSTTRTAAAPKLTLPPGGGRGAGRLHRPRQRVQLKRPAWTSVTGWTGASVGRIGSWLDNAVAESFFATLKKELVRRRSWPNRRELQSAVFDYIESFYNRERRHSTLGYLSPREFEMISTHQQRGTETVKP